MTDSTKKSDSRTKSEVLKKLRSAYKYKPEYAEKLVNHMAEGYSFESFAGLVRVHKSTIYQWVKDHEEFAIARDLAEEAHRMFWERTGMEGMMGGTFEKFNSAVWIFNMKNRFGWTDRSETKTEHVVTLEKLVDNSFDAVETTAKELGDKDELEYDGDDEDPLA